MAGWTAGSPTIAVRQGARAGAWQIERVDAGLWTGIGTLPDGGAPTSDGATAANVAAPDTGADVAVLGSDGTVVPVSLPPAPWVEPWRGIHGLAPLSGRPGFLLVGAAATSIVDDHGTVSSMPIPEGYVVVSSTSDPGKYLLATLADAEGPGGLTESAPFSVFAWTSGSNAKPAAIKDHVARIATSSVGLAWLQTDDGAWWSLDASLQLERRTSRTRDRTTISPDGNAAVSLKYAANGCAQSTVDPCDVSLVDETGSSRSFEGPSLGESFLGGDVAVVLAERTALGLPWRLVAGPVANPSTFAIPLG
jgi:hypothetical protein